MSEPVAAAAADVDGPARETGGGGQSASLLPAFVMLGLFAAVAALAILDALVLLPEPWQHVRSTDLRFYSLVATGLLTLLFFARAGCLAGSGAGILVLATWVGLLRMGGPDPEAQARQTVAAHRAELDALAEAMLTWHEGMGAEAPRFLDDRVIRSARGTAEASGWTGAYERFRSSHGYRVSLAEIRGPLLLLHGRPLTAHLIADYTEWSGIAYLRRGAVEEIEGLEVVRALEGRWYYVTTLR